MTHIRFSLVAVVAGLSLAAIACAGEGGAPRPTADANNLLQNPGLEEGGDPWFSLRPPDFVVSQDVSHSGDASALLPLRGEEGEASKIGYLVQELEPAEFPELLSGFYRVEKWSKGTEKQYLQVVVVAFGSDNLASDFPNHQIRYILAGVDSPPLDITNARFVFASGDEPAQGEWVKFEMNVRDDFEELWGAVPEGFENLRLLFEVRYDGKVPGDGAPEADVFYDDLYIGPPGP